MTLDEPGRHPLPIVNGVCDWSMAASADCFVAEKVASLT